MDSQNHRYPSSSASASKRDRSSVGQLAAVIAGLFHVGTHEKSTLHGASDSIRDPACPIRPWPNSDTDDEQHTPRDLNTHCPETESADESRLIGLLYLWSVLQDSEECT